MSTIRNENNEKYLILRKRYYHECPIEYEHGDDLNLFATPELLQSPGSRSGISEHDLASSGRFFDELQIKSTDSSPLKEPPPYKPPPKVMPHVFQNQEKYSDCVDEFKSALFAMQQNNAECGPLTSEYGPAPKLPPKLKSIKDDANYSKQQILDNASMKSSFSALNKASDSNENKENHSDLSKTSVEFETEQAVDKQISVKEATKKFNRIASEEEASKIISPTAKKRPDKVSKNI